MKATTLLTTALIAVAGFSLSSCKDSETSSSAEVKNQAAPELEKYFTDQQLEEAQDIHIARTTAKPGDEITLKGELMGRENVFVEGRAAFVLGDPTKLTTCDKMSGDTCTTPWDACCDSRELKRIGVASVQILGEDGRVLSTGIKDVNGMKELVDIVVKGTVAENSTEENFIVNAEQIFVTDK
jgi:hypothetical protein